MDRLSGELVSLIRRINRTNSATPFEDETTLSDVLAERDVLGLKRGLLADVAQAASVRQDRYSRSEVKFITSIDVRDLQRQVDGLSAQYRQLDARIQEKNWQTSLKGT